MKKYLIIILQLLAFIPFDQIVFAQNIVNVNQFTGTVGVNIPLFNVQAGSLSSPVSISYSGNGIKVKDIEGSAGMNWQLNVGGRVTRLVRGLPDDCKKNLAGQPRLGWLYNTNGIKINSFNILNDSNPATCPDETADISYINSNFGDLSDTEPDIFYVSAPGLNCQLIFDSNHNIQVIPYQDLKVSYTLGSGDDISSFTIVNDMGTTYTFSEPEKTTRRTVSAGANVSFLKHDYDQYLGAAANLGSGINFTSTWNLQEINNPNGNRIVYSYETGQQDGIPIGSSLYINTADSVNVYTGSTSNTFTKSFQYQIITQSLPCYLTQIFRYDLAGAKEELTLHYSKTYSGMPIISSIDGFGKTIRFNYAKANTRQYLVGLSSSDGPCIDPNSYQFEYTGLTKNAAADSVALPYKIAIPDSTSNEIDYWGYYNASRATNLVPQLYVNPSGSPYERYRSINPGNASSAFPYLLTGTDRSANPETVTLGTLAKITYAEGGSTTLMYESNYFYDNTSGGVIPGAGVRIKRITNYDGINVAHNMVKNYSYLDPATGRSSGKPISMPAFSFTTGYTATSGTTLDKWNYSTVRSSDNLSSEDNTIVYSYVKETQYGAGSTLYHFKTPATNWDNSASPDWAPTVINIGRNSCTANGFMINDKNTYPFPPNTNFDFERGLVDTIITYKDNGQKVSEQIFTYTRTGPPTVVTGLKFENNGTSVAYAKYNTYTNTGELTTLMTQKIYDSQNQTSAQQSAVNYYYNNTQHKLVQQKSTNSNGVVQNNYIKNVKDYVVTLGTDSATNALYYLQQLNINAPVETYSTLTQNGTTNTIGASLVKYKTFTPATGTFLFLPSQKLKFIAVDGTGTFTPSSITSGKFTYDSKYTAVENDLAYDNNGLLLTGDDNFKHIKTMITDHVAGAPVAAISNARYDEIAFNDFNSITAPVGFIKSNYTYSANSRTGQYALALEAAAVLSRNIVKNPKAKQYIFSIWINSVTAGTITITSTSGTTTNTDTLNYSTSFGNWKYLEKKVSITNLAATFTTQFQSNTPILIDDVFFYPDVAEVSAISYDPRTNLKTSQTNTNGISSYFTYDMFDRPAAVYDQDKNIVSRKSYFSGRQSITQLNNLSIGVSGSLVNSPVNFVIDNLPDCLQDQISAIWNFGDGSPTVNAVSSTHTYATSGAKAVSVTVSSPFFSTRTISQTATIVNPPPASIPIHFTTDFGDPNRGSITSMSFKDIDHPGNPAILFDQASLISGVSVPQANYNISFTVGVSHSTAIWKSLQFGDGTSILGCWPITSGVSGSIQLNLKNLANLYIYLLTSDCPLN